MNPYKNKHTEKLFIVVIHKSQQQKKKKKKKIRIKEQFNNKLSLIWSDIYSNTQNARKLQGCRQIIQRQSTQFYCIQTIELISCGFDQSFSGAIDKKQYYSKNSPICIHADKRWKWTVSQNNPQLSPQDQLVTLTAHQKLLKIGNCTERNTNEVCSIMLSVGEFLDLKKGITSSHRHSNSLSNSSPWVSAKLCILQHRPRNHLSLGNIESIFHEFLSALFDKSSKVRMLGDSLESSGWTWLKLF